MPFKIGKGAKALTIPYKLGLPAAAIILGPVTAILATRHVTEEGLAGLEEQLTPGLFTDLAGICLGAAALFYFLADRIRTSNSAKSGPEGESARQKADGLELASSNFLVAFVFSVAGLAAEFSLDGVIQAKFDDSDGYSMSLVTLLEMVRSNLPAIAEVVAGSLALLIIIIQLAIGGLRLVNSLLVLKTS